MSSFKNDIYKGQLAALVRKFIKKNPYFSYLSISNTGAIYMLKTKDILNLFIIMFQKYWQGVLIKVILKSCIEAEF